MSPTDRPRPGDHRDPATPGADRAQAAPPALELTFEGRRIPAHPGQSVGAALVEEGVRSWRSTRHQGRPRGLFCGIGVCYDCLITVDGVPGQRACLVPAEDGMVLGPGEPTRAAPADDTKGGDR
ncbi:(2Fe-2S)-binding protein [Nocardiopsis sediminis]|uniref:(2Fe-2S)-binding protein n=1 Tax=Nocardiopsis sediminis TaxID=1778267 RepID=A0ABV8FPH2_9ACTN